MTDRVVVQDLAEVSSKPTPGSELPAFQVKCSRATFGASAASFTPETAVAPLPPNLAASLLAESWRAPGHPSMHRFPGRSVAPGHGLKRHRRHRYGCLWRPAWPDAQRGVFAFRHDWMEPLVERLEWQTSVTRLASGNESRQARRRVPRRWLTYKVGDARQTDALVADWLADHLGQMALWPLPQYAVHLTESCERGALALNVTEADGRQFGPLSANVHLTYDGCRAGRKLRTMAAGFDHRRRWLADRPTQRCEIDLLWLTEPLARAQPWAAPSCPWCGARPSIRRISRSGCPAWSAATSPHRSSLRHRPTRMFSMTHGSTRSRSGQMATGVTIRRPPRKPRSPARLLACRSVGAPGRSVGDDNFTSGAIWPAHSMKSRSGGRGCGAPKGVWKPSGCPMAWPDPVGDRRSRSRGWLPARGWQRHLGVLASPCRLLDRASRRLSAVRPDGDLPSGSRRCAGAALGSRRLGARRQPRHSPRALPPRPRCHRSVLAQPDAAGDHLDRAPVARTARQ